MQIELIPLITGLVAVLKKTGLPSKYASIVAVVLGIVLVLPQDFSVAGFSIGVFYGLSAVGLWETGKLPEKLSVKK